MFILAAGRLKVGVDIDNTLVMQIHHYISHIKRDINPDFSPSDWRHWDLLELFPDHKDKLLSFMRTYYSRDNISSQDVMHGAHEFLSRFKVADIFYVTARSDWLFEEPKEETIELLEENDLPFIPDNVILQRDASSKMKKCKSLIAKEKGLSFFIEDNPDNALKISKYCPVLLIDYPFNRNTKAKGIHRIGLFDDHSGTWSSSPWEEALKLLESGELHEIVSAFFSKKS